MVGGGVEREGEESEQGLGKIYAGRALGMIINTPGNI